MYYLKRVSFFLSSYLPLFFILFFANLNYYTAIKKKDVVQLLGSNFKFKVLISLIIFIGIIIILLLLNHIFTQKSEEEFNKNTQISYTDYNFLNYFGTFIIPLTTFNPNNHQSVILNILLLLCIYIYYVQTNSFYYNLFAMRKNRRIYKDQFNNFFISDYSLSEIQKLMSSDRKVIIKPITNKIQLILKKDNKNDK